MNRDKIAVIEDDGTLFDSGRVLRNSQKSS